MRRQWLSLIGNELLSRTLYLQNLSCFCLVYQHLNCPRYNIPRHHLVDRLVVRAMLALADAICVRRWSNISDSRSLSTQEMGAELQFTKWIIQVSGLIMKIEQFEQFASW